jgi:L-ribulose-5-phosphate 3-epimerase
MASGTRTRLRITRRPAPLKGPAGAQLVGARPVGQIAAMRTSGRRTFLQMMGSLALAPLALPVRRTPGACGDPLFRISLAEWSLHRALRSGEITNLDFPVVARRAYGLDAVEYVNTFFDDRARDGDYLAALDARAADHGVRNLLIMCDGEGAIGDPDRRARARALENHRRWVEAAALLGCHAIRVNAQSAGTPDEQRAFAADGLRRLTEFGAEHGISVIVENHGGLSSNGAWLASVIRAVDHPHCGTLPDFGNFQLGPDEWYDRYQGVAELMPFAKAVSAKSHAFDEAGDERTTDYRRMLRIVLEAKYHGYVGIEYEGDALSEHEGILATQRLLERVRGELVEAWSG